jgi:hypothetical protein
LSSSGFKSPEDDLDQATIFPWEGLHYTLDLKSSIDVIRSLNSPRHESTTEVRDDSRVYYDWQLALEEKNDDPTIEVDFVQLDAMIDHWMTCTRPVFLTGSKQSLLRNIEEYRKGRTSSARNRTLFRFFKARAAVDQLAQELADAAGIALPRTSCTNFRDTSDGTVSGDLHGLYFHSFRWGLLAPRDDVIIDRRRHVYHKPALWLLVSWAESGKDEEVLHKIIKDANGWSSDRDIYFDYSTSA